MDDHYTFEDFPAFVALLRQFCRKKQSGMLFAATNANQMARIELQQGRISDISFMHKRGSVALTLLTRIQAGRARFSEGVLSESNASRDPLPSSEDILDYLDKAGSHAPPPQPPSPSAAAAAASRAETAAGTVLEAADREVLEALMAEYIGPVAAVICEEHFSSGADLGGILAALAEEIGDRERAQRFMKQAQAHFARAG